MTGSVPQLLVEPLDTLGDGFDGCVDNETRGFYLHVLKCLERDIWVFIESEGLIDLWAKADFTIRTDAALLRQALSERVEIQADRVTEIGGNDTANVGGSLLEAIAGDASRSVTGNVTDAATGNVQRITAGDVTEEVGGVFRLVAPEMFFDGTANFETLSANQISYFFGGAGPFDVGGQIAGLLTATAAIPGLVARVETLEATVVDLLARVEALEAA